MLLVKIGVALLAGSRTECSGLYYPGASSLRADGSLASDLRGQLAPE